MHQSLAGTTEPGVGHPGMAANRSEKDWEKRSVVFVPLTQNWASIWCDLIYVKVFEWINWSAGSWSGHGVCRPGQSEEHSRSTRVRRNIDQGIQKEKLGNLAHLVQKKNVRNKDGNNPPTHKTFLRRWSFYIICGDKDMKKSVFLLQQRVFWLATREHFQDVQGVERGEGLSREIFQESLDKTPCDVSLHWGCPRVGVRQGSLAGGGCLSAEWSQWDHWVPSWFTFRRLKCGIKYSWQES